MRSGDDFYFQLEPVIPVCVHCGHERGDHERFCFENAGRISRCWGENPSDGCDCLEYSPNTVDVRAWMEKQ